MWSSFDHILESAAKREQIALTFDVQAATKLAKVYYDRHAFLSPAQYSAQPPDLIAVFDGNDPKHVVDDGVEIETTNWGLALADCPPL